VSTGNPYYRPNDTAESRLANTRFAVEASGMEMQSIWSLHASDSPERIDPTPLDWRQVSPGWIVTVGQLDGRPVCISLDFAELNGALVCFWHPTSQVVDHVQIETWLSKHFDKTWGGGRRSRCNAMNFHLCLYALAESAPSPEPTP
jgi:hypothetical protein